MCNALGIQPLPSRKQRRTVKPRSNQHARHASQGHATRQIAFQKNSIVLASQFCNMIAIALQDAYIQSGWINSYRMKRPWFLLSVPKETVNFCGRIETPHQIGKVLHGSLVTCSFQGQIMI